jgi:hypothetical protein
MRLGVSYDEEGNITALFDTAQLRSDRVTLAYVPADGEKHHILELPEKLEGTPIERLAEGLRVNLSARHPALETRPPARSG